MGGKGVRKGGEGKTGLKCNEMMVIYTWTDTSNIQEQGSSEDASGNNKEMRNLRKSSVKLCKYGASQQKSHSIITY